MAINPINNPKNINVSEVNGNTSAQRTSSQNESIMKHSLTGDQDKGLCIEHSQDANLADDAQYNYDDNNRLRTINYSNGDVRMYYGKDNNKYTQIDALNRVNEWKDTNSSGKVHYNDNKTYTQEYEVTDEISNGTVNYNITYTDDGKILYGNRKCAGTDTNRSYNYGDSKYPDGSYSQTTNGKFEGYYTADDVKIN